MLSLPLRQTLVQVSSVMREACNEWWVISSAAVALHTAGRTEVGDVDLLITVDDARRIFPILGLEPAPGSESDLFSSDVLGRWAEPPLPVDFMAGFRVKSGGRWQKVSFATRERVDVDDAPVFIPSREELRRTLLTFGRRKDLERARLLATCAPARTHPQG